MFLPTLTGAEIDDWQDAIYDMEMQIGSRLPLWQGDLEQEPSPTGTRLEKRERLQLKIEYDRRTHNDIATCHRFAELELSVPRHRLDVEHRWKAHMDTV